MAGKFQLIKTKTGKFYFNLVASNGQVILTSEIYETTEGAKAAIEAIRRNALNKSHFERRQTINGNPYFILKTNNGQEIGRSETFNSPDAMERVISSVESHSPSAEIESLAK